MTSVLVVDEHVLIRAGLTALISAAPGLEVMGQAADGRAAIAQAAAGKPDVILMDINMPGLNGVAATERILGATDGAKPRILILTTVDLDEYVYAALRAGASGFLLKQTPPEQLIAAIHTIAGGDMLFAPSVTRRLIEAYTQHWQSSVDPLPELRGLTSRELEVLQMVGMGMTNAKIAQSLAVSEATVKTHLNRTMAKLHLSGRAQAVVVAYETGLVVPRRTVVRPGDQVGAGPGHPPARRPTRSRVCQAMTNISTHNEPRSTDATSSEGQARPR